MNKIFLKINFKFYLMLQLTIKFMNTFSYSITIHFILSNKDYNFYRNPHSVYQTYPKWIKTKSITIKSRAS